MSMELVYYLNAHSLRTFTIGDVYNAAEKIKLEKSYIPTLLSHLTKQGVLHHIIKGKYFLSNNVLSGSPLHEFEISMSLTNDSAIAYLSALAYHNLTDQISSKIYSIDFQKYGISQSIVKQYIVDNHTYVVVKAIAATKWGITKKFINSIPFYVTDLERTLIDAISKPQYCLGMREVLQAFTIASDRIDLNKIYAYALKCNIALCKRLGFILESIGLKHRNIELLKAIPVRTYQKLNILGERRGKYHKDWMIVENI